MSPDQVLDTLDQVNQALLIPANGVSPADLLQSVAPYVNSVGRDAQAAYIAAKQYTWGQRLVNPRTGQYLQ